METNDRIEAAASTFIKGAEHMLNNGFSMEAVINGLISAAITCCYHAKEPPDKVRRSLREAANMVPALYEAQDNIGRGKTH